MSEVTRTAFSLMHLRKYMGKFLSIIVLLVTALFSADLSPDNYAYSGDVELPAKSSFVSIIDSTPIQLSEASALRNSNILTFYSYDFMKALLFTSKKEKQLEKLNFFPYPKGSNIQKALTFFYYKEKNLMSGQYEKELYFTQKGIYSNRTMLWYKQGDKWCEIISGNAHRNSAMRVAIIPFEIKADITQEMVSSIFGEHLKHVLQEEVAVITRSEIDKVLDEQNLQHKGNFDVETAVTLGKLVGVQFIVTGGLIPRSAMPKELGMKKSITYVKLISVETGEIINHTTGESRNLTKLLRNTARDFSLEIKEILDTQ